MLLQRLLSAAIALPILIAITWVGGAWFSVAVGLAVLGGTFEFYRAAGKAGGRPLWALGLAFSPLLVAAAHFGDPWPQAALTGLALLGLAGAVARRGASYSDWLWTVGGVMYVGWLASYLVLLRGLDEGRAWALLALLSTFAADTSAYLTGVTWGRHKLAPAISPGKTVEGTLGGLVAGVAAALALNSLLDLGVSPALMAPLGLLVGVAALVGDLAESLLKRSTGIKDASALIPGHGGLLDRMDSVLFVGAVVYYYARWVT